MLAAKGLIEARPKVGTRVRARAEWNLLDPDVLSWRAEASNDRRLYEETTEVRLAIEPSPRCLAATRARAEGDRGAIAEAYAAMEAASPTGGVPGRRSRVPRSDPLRLPQRAARPPRWRTAAVLRTTFELTTTPQRSRRRRPPPSRDPRRHCVGGRGRSRGGCAHVDRGHGSRHPSPGSRRRPGPAPLTAV